MVIEVKQLTKKFDTFSAVEDVTFSIGPGEIVGFVGANGAGKTTTINMLLGFTSSTTGSVRLFDQEITTSSVSPNLKRIGYASSDMELPPSLTGSQYLDHITALHGGDVSSRKAELIDRFAPQLNKKISTLSRGNKQKIALIGAFLTSPELVILDEPTSGLDPMMQDKFIDLLRSEQVRGVTVFMSSHYLAEVADVCSRVILMRHGKIVEDVPASELLARSGKTVVVRSAIANRPPKGADGIEAGKDGAVHSLRFTWKQEPRELQQWLAGLKQLTDIEITEHSLEGAFAGLYDSEGDK